MLRNALDLSGRDDVAIDKPFDRKLGMHRLKYIPGGRTLIVTFDHAGRPQEGPFAEREAWGEEFYLKEGHSVLGVIARKAIWYRDAALITELESLRDKGFFQGFDKVVMTGGSMGGFAAAAFAPLAPGCTVISFSPQATLDSDFVPWETRFMNGQAGDWSLPYGLAGEGIASAGQAYIFTDTLDRGDRAHARMMAVSGNVAVMPVPAAGHGVQPMLIGVGVLKLLTRQCIAGQFDRAGYLHKIRGRKTQLRYFRMLTREALVRDKPQLVLKLCATGMQTYPDADFREMKSLALARLGRLEEAFGVMKKAREATTARARR